jgi:hypothetical protein
MTVADLLGKVGVSGLSPREEEAPTIDSGLPANVAAVRNPEYVYVRVNLDPNARLAPGYYLLKNKRPSDVNDWGSPIDLVTP